MQIKDNREVCPMCGRKNILFTKKTKGYWCRQCGCEWKKEKGGKGGKGGVQEGER